MDIKCETKIKDEPVDGVEYAETNDQMYVAPGLQKNHDESCDPADVDMKTEIKIEEESELQDSQDFIGEEDHKVKGEDVERGSPFGMEHQELKRENEDEKESTSSYSGRQTFIPKWYARAEPQSDFDESDSGDESQDELFMTQQDDEMLMHDLMCNFSGVEEVVTGTSRMKSLVQDDSLSTSSVTEAFSSTQNGVENQRGKFNSGDTDQGISGVNVEEQEQEREELENAESSDNKDIKTKIRWKICLQSECHERVIPEWKGKITNEGKVFEPIEYFRNFFDQELLEMICRESNAYALQKNPSKPLLLGVDELEVFLGICVYMSVVKMSHTRRYWKGDANIRSVTDYMPCDRWEKIKCCLHFVDNSKTPAKGTPEYDKLFKVRPLLNHINAKCKKIPMNKNLCVDKQMDLYKSTRVPRYYIKSNPNLWGFKVWTLADSFGIVHNFEVYIGATQKVEGFPDSKSSANIVRKLSSIIPQHKNYRLFMDNLYLTIPLFFEMYKRGILCMGTVRTNRLSGLKMISDKELKAKGRCAYVEYDGKLETCSESVRVVRWNDGNLCTIMSTMGSAQPTAKIKRWDKSKSTTEKSEVECPALIQSYNSNMGGVDKMHALIALYRMFFRCKKWYHRLFFHFTDLCICNSWLLYRRDRNALEGKSEYLSLHDFKLALSESLRIQNKPLTCNKKGRASTSVDENHEAKKRRGTNTKSIPQRTVRNDQIGHFPVNLTKRGRCKNPTCKSSPVTYCIKCQVFLCSTSEKMCFLEFHGVTLDREIIPK